MKKKLFVSVPMKGREPENIMRDIEKMHKIASAIFGEELELIDSYIEENPPEGANAGLWYMGKSIQMMSEADYFVGIENWLPAFEGCSLEHQAASIYDIPIASVNARHLSPDILRINNELMETRCGDNVGIPRP